MFMFLVAAGLLYKNKQVFANFTAQEKQTSQNTTGAATQTVPKLNTQLPALPTIGNGTTGIDSLLDF